MDTRNEIEFEELVCSDCGEQISPTDIICPKCESLFEDDKNVDTIIEQGRALAIIIILVSLIITLFSGTMSALKLEFSISFLTRLALSVILYTLFYQGYNFARLIMIVLFGIAGLFGIISGIKLLNESWLAVILIFIGVVYISVSVMLLKIKSIKVFQEYQREKRKMSREK